MHFFVAILHGSLYFNEIFIQVHIDRIVFYLFIAYCGAWHLEKY